MSNALGKRELILNPHKYEKFILENLCLSKPNLAKIERICINHSPFGRIYIFICKELNFCNIIRLRQM